MKQLFFALIAFVAAGTVSAQITTIIEQVPAFALKNLIIKPCRLLIIPQQKDISLYLPVIHALLPKRMKTG